LGNELLLSKKPKSLRERSVTLKSLIGVAGTREIVVLSESVFFRLSEKSDVAIKVEAKENGNDVINVSLLTDEGDSAMESEESGDVTDTEWEKKSEDDVTDVGEGISLCETLTNVNVELRVLAFDSEELEESSLDVGSVGVNSTVGDVAAPVGVSLLGGDPGGDVGIDKIVSFEPVTPHTQPSK
jgi:hypothetical protein